MDIIVVVIILFISMILGVLIRKRVVPPICTEYLTSTPKTKESLKNDRSLISLISNIFFMIAISFFSALLMLFFPKIKGFKYITIILFSLMVIYGIYKTISREINRDK